MTLMNHVGSGEQSWPEINVLEDTFCLKLFTTETKILKQSSGGE